MKKIIFIGAGPGGLSAAMLLAHRGYKVEIYEKKDKIGGRNSPLEIGEFTFDMGRITSYNVCYTKLLRL